MTDPELARLLGVAYAAVQASPIDHLTDAAGLYEEASRVAESSMPGPLGTALAGVLAKAAYERRLGGVRGSLGADNTMMALALAVLGR